MPSVTDLPSAGAGLPLPGVVYRAGKARGSGPSLALQRVQRHALPALLCALALAIVAVNRGVLAGLGRAALCGRGGAAGGARARGPLLDAFAGVAAAERGASLRELESLVVVAGHAVYTGRSWAAAALRDEAGWVLAPFQRGQVGTFLAHVRAGVAAAANDTRALLVFSGGQTRGGAGPRSEAGTYWLAADALGWFGAADAVRPRAWTEEYARDSLENLLFSVCRFRQATGRYPARVTVVSFAFKRERFAGAHRAALRFPPARFAFVGIDPPGQSAERLAAAEQKFSLGPFAHDPHGCNEEGLRKKKIERNPYLRFFPYPQGCPELEGLFRHCGREVYKGPLPWDDVGRNTSERV